MNRSELAHFLTALTARESEIARFISNREAATIESSADELDQIQHASEREFALRGLARESASLRDTRAALARIRSGTFGICGDCEAAISPRRLAAAPWAAYCIDCQERADRAGATEHQDDEPGLAVA